MKGPLFYSKILLFENTESFVTQKGFQFHIIFIMVRKKEDNLSRAIQSNGHLKRFVTYLETLQNEQPELVTFDLSL
jgi:mevalonate kinase